MSAWHPSQSYQNLSDSTTSQRNVLIVEDVEQACRVIKAHQEAERALSRFNCQMIRMAGQDLQEALYVWPSLDGATLLTLDKRRKAKYARLDKVRQLLEHQEASLREEVRKLTIATR